jgi:hypothetical protein
MEAAVAGHATEVPRPPRLGRRHSSRILRSAVLPRPLGVAGLAVNAVYLLNQGGVLATAVPGFPVWDLAGLLGSTAWGLWVTALGITVLRALSGIRAPPFWETPSFQPSGPRPSSRRPRPARGANSHQAHRSVPAVVPSHVGDLDRRVPHLPLRGTGRNGGGGRVDDPLSALAGGAVAGLVVGTAQALLSRRRLTYAFAYALVPTGA